MRLSKLHAQKKRKVVKPPNPFPLLKPYRHDVEVALSSKKLTKETRSQFLSAVASSILTFKHYPTPDEYKNIALSICKE